MQNPFLDFKEKPGHGESRYFLNYFLGYQEVIDHHVIIAISIHLRILQVFNEIFDGAFYRNGEWHRLVLALEKEGEQVVAAVRARKG